MTFTRRPTLASLVATVALACALTPSRYAAAASVTPGYTFSVASQSGLPLTGTHFHSNHAGALGNPADKAEVGSLQDQAMSMEECRGLSEFNLAGLGLASSATLDFKVFHPGGLFPGQNDFGFIGNIGVLVYTGNNAEDVPDYQAVASPAGTFSTAGLAIGSPISFNVTSLYNAQISGGSPSMGVRLQITPATVTGGGAFTFDTFTLTVTPIPEPTALSMAAISGVALLRRRRARE